MHGVRIDQMTPEDWPDVRSIYEEGIATLNATFEAEARSTNSPEKHGRLQPGGMFAATEPSLSS